MSLVSKKGLEFIINQVGKAKYAYKDLVGDLSLKHGYYLDYERIVVKFRGSTIFHDYDLAGKTPQGLTSKPYQTFDTNENISFGFQGGQYTLDQKISSFANTGGWTPQYYNPPATEGWGVWDYNAWQYFVPPYNAAGNANTSYIIYNINSEPGDGSERTNYDYPVRWDGSLYRRVNLFNSSRWVSIKNTGTISNNEAHLVIPKSYFEGAQFINPLTNTPKDLGIASHIFLKTEGIGSTFSLGGSMAGLALTYLAYNVSEVSSTGSTLDRIKDHYLFKVKTPASWTTNYWYHLAFYWDTHDTDFFTSYPAYTSGTAVTFNSNNLLSAWNIYPRKTYLQKDINNYLRFDKTGVNDTNIYLFSRGKTNQKYFDGDYITTNEPFRYLYPETFSAYGDTNSLASYVTLNAYEYLPVLIATKNIISGNQYENGDIDFYLFFGKAMPQESVPVDWYDFKNYPTIDNNYDIVAKIILSYPTFKTSGTIKNKTNTTYNLNNASIVYIDKKADNFAVPPIGDSTLVEKTLQDVIAMTEFTRSDEYKIIYDKLGADLIAPFSNFKINGSSSYYDIKNNSYKKSKLLHNLLKYPIAPALKSNYQTTKGSGKITITSGNNIVIGNSSKFTTEITEGDYLYSSDGTVLYGQVLSIITDTYLTLEENYKSSVDSLAYNIKNSPLETEPTNIEVDESGANAMISWLSTPPTKIVFKYDENGMKLNDVNFENNTEFEFYQEVSNVPDLLDQETAGSKLSKDYSFSIVFQNANSDKFIKNIKINSSKFFITDDEYLNRQKKNLSISGYFKQGTQAEKNSNAIGTFNSIEEYRLYGSAAIIPNMQMGESRTILTKQVQPIDSTKQTETAFIADLKSANPNITETEIQDKISDYELTKSFYTPDSNQFLNTFSTIKEIGMSVSNYAYNRSKHWISNYDEVIGSEKENKIFTAQNVLDLRSDSFIISIAGYSTSDASINSLENLHKQQISIIDATNINQTTKGNYKSVNYNRFAFKISPNEYQDIKSLKIRLQSLAVCNNPDAYIQISIWDDYNSLPNAKLITGSKVFYTSIKNILDDVYFYLNYSFTKNRTYWIVFESNTNPPNYDEKTLGLVNVSGTAVSGLYNSNNNTTADFNRYQKYASIGFGSTLSSNISTWYEIASIGSSSLMTLSGSVGVSDNQNYVIKYDLRLQIQETSTPTASNMAFYDGFTWSASTGTPYVEFYGLDHEIYAGFNRDFSNSSLVMPAPNKTRANDVDYYVDEFWTVNNQNLFTPSQLYIYPRSFVSRVIAIGATGANATNLLYIPEENFDPSIMVGIAVTSSVLASGTAVTSLTFDSNINSYKIYLSNNLSGSANTHYFGDNSNKIIKRANDIHLYLKYNVDNQLQTKYVKLDKSPTWITQWYKKSSWNYFELDSNEMSDLTSAHHNINFDNFGGLAQTNYFNGYAIGNFTALSSIGATFDFKVTTNGGVKLYINNQENPYISDWNNTSLSSFTTSFVATGSSQPIELELQFNNYQNAHNLKLEWRKTGEVSWQEVNSSFYQESAVGPILIDSNKIENLTYLVVGKTLEEINDQYYGFPVTDKIVIRSK
jgi:hypothetical protein